VDNDTQGDIKYRWYLIECRATALRMEAKGGVSRSNQPRKCNDVAAVNLSVYSVVYMQDLPYFARVCAKSENI
jgi:hypothetical protein